MTYANPNITNPIDIFNYTNTNACMDSTNPATCNMFGILIIFAIFAISFIATKDQYPAIHSFTLGSFLSFFFSVFFLALGWIPSWVTMAFMVLTALGSIVLLKTNTGD